MSLETDGAFQLQDVGPSPFDAASAGTAAAPASCLFALGAPAAGPASSTFTFEGSCGPPAAAVLPTTTTLLTLTGSRCESPAVKSLCETARVLPPMAP
jgi:hypothetical protein